MVLTQLQQNCSVASSDVNKDASLEAKDRTKDDLQDQGPNQGLDPQGQRQDQGLKFCP